MKAEIDSKQSGNAPACQAARYATQSLPRCATITVRWNRRRRRGFVLEKRPDVTQELEMGRYLLLWMVGIPFPVLVLIWAFGGLHG